MATDRTDNNVSHYGAQLYPAGTRLVASDGALELTGADRAVGLVGSAAGAKAATFSITEPMGDGQSVALTLFAATGGSYTVACSTIDGTSGTLTLDAAGEGADLSQVDGVLYVMRLVGGATFA